MQWKKKISLAPGTMGIYINMESQTIGLYSINSHTFNPLSLLDKLWPVSLENKEHEID